MCDSTIPLFPGHHPKTFFKNSFWFFITLKTKLQQNYNRVCFLPVPNIQSLILIYMWTQKVNSGWLRHPLPRISGGFNHLLWQQKKISMLRMTPKTLPITTTLLSCHLNQCTGRASSLVSCTLHMLQNWQLSLSFTFLAFLLSILCSSQPLAQNIA